MKPKVSKILKHSRADLESIYGRRMANMILFGSLARGDAAPGSDVDVLLVLQNGR
jgi:predicted nucleotidyltransferase